MIKLEQIFFVFFRFLCQTSSLDFLISQDFDFNKLFKESTIKVFFFKYLVQAILSGHYPPPPWIIIITLLENLRGGGNFGKLATIHSYNIPLIYLIYIFLFFVFFIIILNTHDKNILCSLLGRAFLSATRGAR